MKSDKVIKEFDTQVQLNMMHIYTSKSLHFPSRPKIIPKALYKEQVSMAGGITDVGK